MQAEIIAIGDELTSGQRLDTNSQWLSQQLGDIGIRTLFHTTVADDLEANIMAFRQAAKRVDVIVCTGGLGPTADDLTREAIASAFDRDLYLDDSSLEQIRHLFASRGREMPERNRVQALFPAGSQPIPNPHGTAPGIDLEVSGNREVSSDRDEQAVSREEQSDAATSRHCRIFSLPGVPAEMKEMWAESVRPSLITRLGAEARVVRHYRLKCFGTGESALEAMLPDLIQRGRNPTVGITVSKATITLRMTGQAESEEAYRQLIQPTVDTIRQCLGNLVFGEEDDELQHAIARILIDRNKTISVAEWGTGGLISDWLSGLHESQHVFRGGTITSSRPSAEHVLGVDPALDAAEHAKSMATSIRERYNADFGIAVGELPQNVADEKLFIGLATKDDVLVAGRRFAGHPDILKERAAKQALDLLRLHLLD